MRLRLPYRYHPTCLLPVGPCFFYHIVRRTIRNHPKVFALILLMVSLWPIYLYNYEYMVTYEYHDFTVAKSYPSKSEIELFSNCFLPEQPSDGWTPEVRKNSHPDKDPLAGCDSSFKPYTVLGENGTVWIDPDYATSEIVRCKARSIMFDGDRETRESEWWDLTVKASKVAFTSDFVNTQCWNETGDKVFEYIHTQIWPENLPIGNETERVLKTATVKELKREQMRGNDSRPSVLILVLDSISNAHAKRALPKTIEYLKSTFNSTSFDFLNQVGVNSRPNSFAFLLGQLTTEVERAPFGMPPESIDLTDTESCNQEVDTERFILSRFTKNGYKSLYAEDWGWVGVFSYPGCKAFPTSPTTRYFKPFLTYLEEKVPNRTLHDCYFPYQSVLEYYGQFAEHYREGVPKISLLWTNHAHNNLDDIFHMDAVLLDFFKKHESQLQESYVFVMADHGPRWGAYSRTSMGYRETKNPFFYMSVPRNVRERLQPVIIDNSRKLITHFDLYDTFVHILQDPFINSSRFTANSRGNTLLQTLPKGERTCRTLPIPIQYCMCEWKQKELRGTPSSYLFTRRLGIFVTGYANHMVRAENLTDICETWSYTSVDVTVFESTAFLYTVEISAGPCDAEFKAIVRSSYLGKLTMVSKSVIRTNMYGHQADCLESSTKGHMRGLCCCKSRS